jgi:hypothetical protein
VLGDQREEGMREYFRQPYGNEEEGLSPLSPARCRTRLNGCCPSCWTYSLVLIKPWCLSLPKPRRKGAEQANDAVNHVCLHNQQRLSGPYTAFKDADGQELRRQRGARTPSARRWSRRHGATAEMLAMIPL